MRVSAVPSSKRRVIHRQDYTYSSGGLFIYARSDVFHRRLFNVENKENRSEFLSIEFPIGKVKTIVSYTYKHPKVTNALFKTYFSQMCDSIVMILFLLAI